MKKKESLPKTQCMQQSHKMVQKKTMCMQDSKVIIPYKRKETSVLTKSFYPVSLQTYVFAGCYNYCSYWNKALKLSFVKSACI